MSVLGYFPLYIIFDIPPKDAAPVLGRISMVYCIHYTLYNNNNNNNNKIRFGNCLGEGRSTAYQVFHPFMITRRKNYIGI